MMILGIGGFSFKAVWRNTKLPRWARISSRRAWKLKFFDRHAWLKYVLIKLFQAVIITAIFIGEIFIQAVKMAKKIVLSRKTSF